ncbi:MAG: RNA polymerase factor sigma-54 [Bacteroidota bacterium]|nr:RNA polymerase factor sigma-54 [Bacteroidota bacterium]
MNKIILKQNLSQKLSPQQIQFIKLLQLSNTNIDSVIKKELEDNPALEEETVEIEENETISSAHLENYSFSQKNYNSENINYSRESNLSNKQSFQENLLSQITYLDLDHDQEIIAKQIIGTLDADGYLRRDLELIIDDLAFSENKEFEIKTIKKVLKKIQNLEPPGIGSRNLEECLIIQINKKEEINSTEKLALNIIKYDFENFKNKHFEKIYEKYEGKKEKIIDAFNYIKTLNPKPAGGLEDENITEYLIPDFVLKKINNELNIFLTSGENKKINVNKHYISIFNEMKNKKNKNEESKKSIDFIKQKIESAQWFVDALNQRNQTLLKTMKAILKIQNSFFNDGDENDLKPMILKDIAEIIKMDISTVSRIVRSKVIQTDFGIFPLKYFFSESTIKKNDELISSKIVKNSLKKIIEKEDKTKPYSDEKLEKILNQKGYEVARRTVSKYREQLKIPVARLRKEF